MNLNQYQALVTQLLQDHFGRTIAETRLTDTALQIALFNDVPPYKTVNDLAIELDLRRTDLEIGNAYPRAPLGNVDQYRATVKLSLQSVRAGLHLPVAA